MSGDLYLANNRMDFRRPLCLFCRRTSAVSGALLAIIGSSAIGADYSLSGFGTLGYAKSAQPFIYDRFVDNRGTFRRDSVAGLQIDGKLTETVGGTVQMVAEPSKDDDRRYQGSVAWAFVSWRPSDDWLFRAGKQRIPLYLYSQTYNVGVTYDFVRPPVEMYSISPNNDYVGLSFSKTWTVASDEIALEGNWGKTDIDSRVWLRDNIPGIQASGATYRRLAAQGAAVSLVYRRDEDIYRAGIYRSKLSGRNGEVIPVAFPFVSLFPGVGYFQPSSALPGPGVPQIKQIDFSVLSLGADVDLGSGFRALGEFARSVSNKTDFNETSNRGYLSALKHVERWTPYVTFAFVKSARGPLNLNRTLNSNTVPGFVPGADLINASQRAAADQVRVQDQHSVAIGTAYSLSATQKVKAELMRVRIGRVSNLVDSPPGGDINHQSVNVFSLSYSFVF